MNTTQRILLISTLAVGVALPMAGYAQTSPNPSQVAAPASDSMTDGEVKKIDPDNGKVTLKHGDIKNLDMPGMTMVFQVKDAALLDKVKAGDKVNFTAEKADGGIVVTAIEAVK